MSIDRATVPTLDYSDLVEPGGKLPPIHPGEILREEFMEPLGLNARGLVEALHIPADRVIEIVDERRGITADLALRLARYFDGSAEFWLGLQKDYELRLARQESLPRIAREIQPRVENE